MCDVDFFFFFVLNAVILLKYWLFSNCLLAEVLSYHGINLKLSFKQKATFPTISCGLKKTHWICSGLAENGRWTRRWQKINPLSQTLLQKAASCLLWLCNIWNAFIWSGTGEQSIVRERQNDVFLFWNTYSFLSFLFFLGKAKKHQEIRNLREKRT